MSREDHEVGFTAENLRRVIDLCRTVAAEGADPFGVDVKRYLVALREKLSSWQSWEELILDSGALGSLSSIIRLQWEWIRHEASTMKIDPAMLELKIRISDPKALSNAFLKSWHPIMTISHIGVKKLLNAMDYWNSLLPFSQRISSMPSSGIVEFSDISLEELIKMRALSDEEFESLASGLLTDLDEEFRKGDGRVEYWSFVKGKSPEETYMRGYVTSFLVTCNKAALSIDPIQEKIYIIPASDLAGKPQKSVAISLSGFVS